MRRRSWRARVGSMALLLALVACQPSTSPLPDGGSPGTSGVALPVQDTLVVGVRPGADAEALARRVGARVAASLPALGAVLLQVQGARPDADAVALSLTGQPGVAFAAAQHSGTADASERGRAAAAALTLDSRIDALPQYALDALHLNVQAAWRAGLRGAGVTVAVVDGPVDVTQPDLSARWAGRAYDAGTGTEYVTAATWTAAVQGMAGGTLRPDDLDHGTAVASAAVASVDGQGVAGAAPDARFVTAAVFRPAFAGSFEAARAVVWAVDTGARVVVLPWSSAGYDPLLKAATDYALARRVTVVAATGNGGQVVRTQPAMYPGVLPAVASDAAGRKADFSGSLPGMSPWTPGVDVLLARPGWGAGTGGSALYSGTAFSAGQLGGAAALLLGAAPDLDAFQVRSLLEAAAPGGPLNAGALPALLAGARPLPGAEAHVLLRVQTPTGSVPGLLGDVTLVSADPAGPVYLARTDGSGQADFLAVQPGTYRVLAAAPDLTVTGGAASDRGETSGTLTLPAGGSVTGTFTLDRGAVDLHPVDPYEPNDDPASATPITYGSRTAVAYIGGKPRDLDFFRFQGQAGDRVRAGVTAKGNAEVGGQLDSVLVLRGPDGTVLGYNDDFSTPDARLEATLPVSGTFTVEVSSYRILGPSAGTDPAAGSPDDSPFNRYRLQLDRLNAP